MINKLKNFWTGWKKRSNMSRTQVSEIDIQKMDPKDLEAFAQLVASTTGELKAIDHSQVEKGPGSKKALQINPQQLIKDAVAQAVPRPPSAPVPAPYVGERSEVPDQYRVPPAQPFSPVPPTPTSGTIAQMVVLDTATVAKIMEHLANFEARLNTVAAQVETLQTTNGLVLKALENMLNNGIKTITLKYDTTTGPK